VLEAADGIEAQRAGPDRAERLFHAWLAHQRLERNATKDAEIEGWVDLPNDTNPVTGRQERVRLLSIDGLSDPRNEQTELDTEFDILHDLSVLPTTFQASADGQQQIPSLEQSISEYQKMAKELDGRASFTHDLSAYP
jgi:hypothetical protein